MDSRVLLQVMTASGVKVTADEAEVVARSLAPIEHAASELLSSLSLDISVAQFAGLLESDTAAGRNT